MFQKQVYVATKSFQEQTCLQVAPLSSLEQLDVEKRVGRGQFSEVFRARVLNSGDFIALKKVRIFELADSKARADCLKEIALLQVSCVLYFINIYTF